MIEIIKTNWLNEDAGEAELILSDGQFELLCFAHPWREQIIGEENVFELLDNVVQSSNDTQDKVERKENSYSHQMTGEIEDLNKGLLKVGKFKFYSENFPKDLNDGSRIEVSCDRISW